MPARIAVTTGEPAGIGPDVVLPLFSAFSSEGSRPLAVLADPGVLAARAEMLGLEFDPADHIGADCDVRLIPLRARARVDPGKPNPSNAPHVLEQIARAADGCISGEFAAMVTGPVDKNVISTSGTPFLGHTEHLRDLAGAEDAMMMFASPTVRLGLATTHLPLSEVAAAISVELVFRKISALADGMKRWFSAGRPLIRVTGLNPHAGEGGLLGREETEVIQPAIDRARLRDINVEGPISADTAMLPGNLSPSCAVLSMFHDQCLPAAKALDFHGMVNVTLGLPFLRTSVDHGTAGQLAGTGRANALNMRNAVRMAVELTGGGQ